MLFSKYHGYGNDFLITEETRILNNIPHIIQLCDRHQGIGADGMLVYDASKNFMHIINSDGSEATMCANGLRCLVHYLYDHGILVTSISTRSGVRQVRIIQQNPFFSELCLGKPKYDWQAVGALLTETIPKNYLFHGIPLDAYPCYLTNAHLVVFVPLQTEANLLLLGNYLSTHPDFPHGINVDFVTIHTQEQFSIRTYERGAGLTLSCGSGVAASMVMGHVTKQLESHAQALMPLGKATVWMSPDGEVYLAGTTERVFCDLSVI